MQYTVNEGSFTLPETAEDRSLNMFLLNVGPGGLTLVVTRERLLDETETDQAFIDRQLKNLTKQVKNFKEHDRQPVRVGSAQLYAIQLHTSFKQNGASVHQQQTVIALGGGKVLTLTLTCASPLNEEQKTYAQQLLDSFTPPVTNADPVVQ